MLVDLDGPDTMEGDSGSDDRRYHFRRTQDRRSGLNLAFEFDTLEISSSVDAEDDNMSISHHPVDEPLLESLVTTQTCPVRTTPRSRPHHATSPTNKSHPQSARHSRPFTVKMPAYLPVKGKDDARQETESRAEDEGTREETESRAEGEGSRGVSSATSKVEASTAVGTLDAGSSCDHNSQAENTPVNRDSQAEDTPVNKDSAYDLSSCSTAVLSQDSETVETGCFEGEEPLLPLQDRALQGCHCSNQQPQQPKYARRSINPLRSLPNLRMQSGESHSRLSMFDLKSYRKYEDMGHEVEMPGTPVIADNLSLRQFIAMDDSSLSTRSFTPASDASTNPPVLRRTKPISLSYDDLQERFKSEIELHDELDHVIQRSDKERPIEAKLGYFPAADGSGKTRPTIAKQVSPPAAHGPDKDRPMEAKLGYFPAADGSQTVTVNTLRAPLDAQLSTLYEDDDEDSDIISSVASMSFNRMSYSKSQKLAEYLHRDGMCSFDYYSTPLRDSKDEGDNETHLLGEDLLDVDNPDTESSTSRRRALRELVEKYGRGASGSDVRGSQDQDADNIYEDLLQGKSEHTDEEEDDLMLFHNDTGPKFKLASQKLVDSNKKATLQSEAQACGQMRNPENPVLTLGSSPARVAAELDLSVEDDAETESQTMVLRTDPSEVSELTDDDFREASQRDAPRNTAHLDMLNKQISTTKGDILKQFKTMKNMMAMPGVDQSSSAFQLDKIAEHPESESSTPSRPLTSLLRRPKFGPMFAEVAQDGSKKTKKKMKMFPKQSRGNQDTRRNKNYSKIDEGEGLDLPVVQRWPVEERADNTPDHSPSSSRSRTCAVKSVGSATATQSFYQEATTTTTDGDTSGEDNGRKMFFSDDDESDPFAQLHYVGRLAI